MVRCENVETITIDQTQKFKEILSRSVDHRTNILHLKLLSYPITKPTLYGVINSIEFVLYIRFLILKESKV